jgi:hypothetical protein
MAYVDPQFNTPIQDTVIGGGPGLGVSLGTVTASATQTYTGTAGTMVNGTFRLPVFKQPVKIQGIRVYTTGAPGSGVTGLVLGFYNGTSLIGTVTPVSTAGSFADVTLATPVVGSNGVTTGPVFFTGTNNEITMINTATGTGASSGLGSYSVDLVWTNLFVS